jgi:DUF438 domain-containing protein
VPINGFTRSLTEHNTKIVSVCEKCGHKIVASVTEGLQDKEQEHAATCKGRGEKS